MLLVSFCKKSLDVCEDLALLIWLSLSSQAHTSHHLASVVPLQNELSSFSGLLQSLLQKALIYDKPFARVSKLSDLVLECFKLLFIQKRQFGPL